MNTVIFLWFIVAAGSPSTGGYSNSSFGVAVYDFSWSRSSFSPASCPMWITLPSGSPDNVLGNAYNSYGVAYVCFIWSRSTDYGRSNCVWAVYLNSATLYEWVNTSNQFGVAADHFGGRGVFYLIVLVIM